MQIGRRDTAWARPFPTQARARRLIRVWRRRRVERQQDEVRPQSTHLGAALVTSFHTAQPPRVASRQRP